MFNGSWKKTRSKQAVHLWPTLLSTCLSHPHPALCAAVYYMYIRSRVHEPSSLFFTLLLQEKKTFVSYSLTVQLHIQQRLLRLLRIVEVYNIRIRCWPQSNYSLRYYSQNYDVTINEKQFTIGRMLISFHDAEESFFFLKFHFVISRKLMYKHTHTHRIHYN